MQPTYLPWSGFFNLIQSVDIFVFFDDAQLSKQSWQTRNRVLLHGAEHFLSVPTSAKDFRKPICEVRIPPGNWHKKHWKTIESAYRKSPFFSELADTLATTYSCKPPVQICELNIDIITRVAKCIGVNTSFVRSSQLSCTGTRSEKLYNICLAVGCDKYLSPVGAREYLEQDGFSEKHKDVKLEYQCFNPKTYSQLDTPQFVSHLSFVDVLANIGLAGFKDYCE